MDRAIILKGDNWAAWKFQITIVLKAKELFEVVSSPLQKDSKNEDKDRKAQEIIATRVEEHVLTYLITCSSAFEMWEKLMTIYESKSKVGVHLVQQQFYSLKYESPMAAFIAKIEDIIHKLSAFGEKVSEKMVITKVIMSLPEEFKHFVSASESVPEADQSLKQLTARLLVEEERIQGTESDRKEASTALAAVKKKGQHQYATDKKKTEAAKCFSCGKVGHYKRDCRLRKCNYCGKPGHLYKDCYNRNKRDKSQNMDRAYITLSDEYQNLWILDTGASDHMCNDRQLFYNYTEVQRLVGKQYEVAKVTKEHPLQITSLPFQPRKKNKEAKMAIIIGRTYMMRTGTVVLIMAGSASARVAGKVGGYSNHMGGKSTSGINEEIIWISISMAIAIAVLIAIALCYILKEKCSKRAAYREQS